MVLIGIDPDIDKSGVAYYFRRTKELNLYNFRFFELYEDLKNAKEIYEDFKVIVEAGWLNNKSNWHNEKSGVRIAARIGKNTGSNHEAGRKIVEMLEYLGISYELRRPFTSKINSESFKKITKYSGRTNQETRDAAMLIYGL